MWKRKLEFGKLPFEKLWSCDVKLESDGLPIFRKSGEKAVDIQLFCCFADCTHRVGTCRLVRPNKFTRLSFRKGYLEKGWVDLCWDHYFEQKRERSYIVHQCKNPIVDKFQMVSNSQ